MLQLSAPRTWGLVTYPAGATFGSRAMDDWEWVWIIDGHARYRRDDFWFAAPAGSLLLCGPGATDFFEWDTARRTRHAFCHFSIQNLPDDWPATAAWPVVQILPDADILRPLRRYLLNWAGRGDSEITRLTLEQMLTCWVRAEIDAAPLPRDDWPEAVALACKYLQHRLNADSAAAIALDELVRRFRFARTFVPFIPERERAFAHTNRALGTSGSRFNSAFALQLFGRADRPTQRFRHFTSCAVSKTPSPARRSSCARNCEMALRRRRRACCKYLRMTKISKTGIIWLMAKLSKTRPKRDNKIIETEEICKAETRQ